MRRSNDPKHRQAARLLEEAFRGTRQYDARIVHVRPDIKGAQAYGGDLDRAAEAIHAQSVTSIRIVDIPYPNRL